MKKNKKLWKSIVGVVLCFVMVAAWFDMPMEVRAAAAPRAPRNDDCFVGSDGEPVSGQPNIAHYLIPMEEGNGWSKNLLVYYNSGTDGNNNITIKYRGSDPITWVSQGNNITGDAHVLADSTEAVVNGYIAEGYPFFWVTDSDDSGEGRAHTHSWTYGTIVTATESSDGLEGEYCECGATRNTTPIPSGDVIINDNYLLIDWSYPGHTTTLNMKTMCNLSQAFMKRLASKNNCDFVIKLVWNNKPYEFYVPAGTQFDTSLDYYGVEKLMEMFEYKQL